MVKTIFEICKPREDVLKGTSSESDFAADLSRVICAYKSGAYESENGTPPEYSDSRLFFETTYPTRGLRSLLENVCARLSGKWHFSSPIFRLGTSFGGGKTHGLIALVHAARGMKNVDNPAEFLNPELIPQRSVRIAVFDGENADPANGRKMEEGLLAYTPWGEIAYALAGREGYERVRCSDKEGISPGADTLRELFGGEPALILLDELAVYLRKVKHKSTARDQFTAFLTGLFKAVECSPHVALVFTLAIGKDGKAIDAYAEENQFVAEKMAEIESISGRKATLLNPTEEDETLEVLRRRLFEHIDEDAALENMNAYRDLWQQHQSKITLDRPLSACVDTFKKGFPLHPDVFEMFTTKTATLANFQRVRGMLRILGYTIRRLWETKPKDATAIHVHHIDIGYQPIREDITTRLGQKMYDPAIRADIAGDTEKPALAQQIDSAYQGLPPYATYTARTIFMHSLAFNENLKGITVEHLRYACLSPQLEINFLDQARQNFVQQSAYLDDRPKALLRFLAEANLTQIIQQEEKYVDLQQQKTELNDEIKSVFKGKDFSLIFFPTDPREIEDSAETPPALIVLSHEACSVGVSVESVPELIARLYKYKTSDRKSLRHFRNNNVFVVAEEERIAHMNKKMTYCLALRAIKENPSRMHDLAEHQRDKVKELEKTSKSELAIAIQTTFRHIFYPSSEKLPVEQGDQEEQEVSLKHAVLNDVSSACPGSGQQQIIRALREDYQKLRRDDDSAVSPGFILNRTPLREKGEMTTAALRQEFYCNVKLPILLGKDIFIKSIRKGVEEGSYIYRSGSGETAILYGQGDPYTEIKIDEQSVISTMEYAKEHGIWPRVLTPKPLPDLAPEAPVIGDSSQPLPVPSSTGGQETVREPQPGGIRHNPICEEGVFKQVLRALWDKTKQHSIDEIARIDVKITDPTDGFRFLGGIGHIALVPQKNLKMVVDYATEKGRFSVEYEGEAAEASVFKEFLEPQLRIAKESNFEMIFSLRFEPSFSLRDEENRVKLSDQLTRFISAAQVFVTIFPSS
ncbi:MAG: ATP-binding protein [Acetobacter sp.]|nr:ATP-binding protein [Acetobacter sp.]